MKTAGEKEALCFINPAGLCLNSIVFLRRWIDTRLPVQAMQSQQSGRSGVEARGRGRAARNRGYHVLPLVHEPKNYTHRWMYHPQLHGTRKH